MKIFAKIRWHLYWANNCNSHRSHIVSADLGLDTTIWTAITHERNLALASSSQVTPGTVCLLWLIRLTRRSRQSWTGTVTVMVPTLGPTPVRRFKHHGADIRSLYRLKQISGSSDGFLDSATENIIRCAGLCQGLVLVTIHRGCWCQLLLYFLSRYLRYKTLKLNSDAMIANNKQSLYTKGISLLHFM